MSLQRRVRFAVLTVVVVAFATPISALGPSSLGVEEALGISTFELDAERAIAESQADSAGETTGFSGTWSPSSELGSREFDEDSSSSERESKFRNSLIAPVDKWSGISAGAVAAAWVAFVNDKDDANPEDVHAIEQVGDATQFAVPLAGAGVAVGHLHVLGASTRRGAAGQEDQPDQGESHETAPPYRRQSASNHSHRWLSWFILRHRGEGKSWW